MYGSAIALFDSLYLESTVKFLYISVSALALNFLFQNLYIFVTPNQSFACFLALKGGGKNEKQSCELRLWKISAKVEISWTQPGITIQDLGESTR